MVERGSRADALAQPGSSPSRLRADAAANRERILGAAERVFATTDAGQVTMDQIAKAARVGRATLYRRFQTPAAVAVALLDEHERRLQEDLMRGDPPLGPGAPPAERLAAFYAAMVRLLERHLHLALGAETGRARFRTGAYGFWRLHVRSLLVAGEIQDVDATVDVVLAPLAPELYDYQRHELGLSQRRIARSLAEHAHRLFGQPAG